MNLNFWTKEEDDILRQYFPTEGRRVSKRLPGRSENACCSEAYKLGLCQERVKNGWTDEEIAILTKYFPSMGPKVAEKLPGRSENACQYRACVLGVRLDRSVRYKGKRAPWTEAEDDILRRYFPTERNGVYKRLPGREAMDCYRRARKLGLVRKYTTAPKIEVKD